MKTVLTSFAFVLTSLIGQGFVTGAWGQTASSQCTCTASGCSSGSISYRKSQCTETGSGSGTYQCGNSPRPVSQCTGQADLNGFSVGSSVANAQNTSAFSCQPMPGFGRTSCANYPDYASCMAENNPGCQWAQGTQAANPTSPTGGSTVATQPATDPTQVAAAQTGYCKSSGYMGAGKVNCQGFSTQGDCSSSSCQWVDTSNGSGSTASQPVPASNQAAAVQTQTGTCQGSHMCGGASDADTCSSLSSNCTWVPSAPAGTSGALTGGTTAAPQAAAAPTTPPTGSQPSAQVTGACTYGTGNGTNAVVNGVTADNCASYGTLDTGTNPAGTNAPIFRQGYSDPNGQWDGDGPQPSNTTPAANSNGLVQTGSGTVDSVPPAPGNGGAGASGTGAALGAGGAPANPSGTGTAPQVIVVGGNGQNAYDANDPYVRNKDGTVATDGQGQPMCKPGANCGVGNNNAITEQNKSGRYGGLYGGANVQTTQMLNAGVTQANKAMQMIGSMSTQNTGTQQYANVAAQGYGATQASIAQAQANTLEAAAKAAETAGFVGVGLAGTQAFRGYQHLHSEKAVNGNASAALPAVQASLNTDCAIQPVNSMGVTPTAVPLSLNFSDKNFSWASIVQANGAMNTPGAISQKCREDFNTYSTVKTNQVQEDAAQNAAFVGETVAAATTGVQAYGQFMQATADKNQANEALTAASGFNFNPGTNGFTGGDGTGVVGAPSPGSLVNGAALSGAGIAGGNQLNPGVDGALGSNVPAGSLAAGVGAAPPPASGSALGSTGGTTAAKDDPNANQANAGASKAAVGSFSATDGTNGGYSRAQGAPAVGIQSNFTDLLKSMLPGDKEANRNPANMNFSNGSQNNAAAVIPRNEDIFQHVSKKTRSHSSDKDQICI